jgi:hypothetical protein
MIRMKGAPSAEKSAKSGEAIPKHPILGDVIETHRLEVDNGALATNWPSGCARNAQVSIPEKADFKSSANC